MLSHLLLCYVSNYKFFTCIYSLCLHGNMAFSSVTVPSPVLSLTGTFVIGFQASMVSSQDLYIKYIFKDPFSK